MITKTAGSLTGVRYVIEGGVEKSLEEIGAPEGTTFLVHNLFYNTPARKKFLKSASSEAGYVSDLLERMALSHPNIPFKFISNRDTKLHTSGNCNLKDIIYSIYGRDIAANLVTAEADYGNIRIRGFIGKPVISRGNRNYENYFVNGRYVKSTIIARAIEDAYKAFMMSHRYPFTVLQIEVNTEEVDVNVHPQKLEVRFANQQEIYEKVLQTVKEALLGKELIPEFTIDGPKKAAEEKRPDGRPSGSMSTGRTGSSSQGSTAANVPDTDKKARYPEPFEKIRSQLIAEANSPYEIKYPQRDRPQRTHEAGDRKHCIGGRQRFTAKAPNVGKDSGARKGSDVGKSSCVRKYFDAGKSFCVRKYFDAGKSSCVRKYFDAGKSFCVRKYFDAGKDSGAGKSSSAGK